MPKGKPYKTGTKYRVKLGKATDKRKRKKPSKSRRMSDDRIGY